MKKGLLSIITISLFALVAINVDAETIAVENIKPNTYIVGEEAYELGDGYYFTIYDLANAAAKYGNKYNTDVAPVYMISSEKTGVDEEGNDIISSYLVEAIKASNNSDIEFKRVENKTTLNIESINEVATDDMKKEYIEEAVDPEIEKVAEKLNNDSPKYGLKTVKYDSETKTSTVDIKEIDASLLDYDLELDYFRDLYKTNKPNAVKAKITYGEKEKVLEVSDAKAMRDTAKDVVKYLLGEELEYKNAVGKEVTAYVEFEDYYGMICSATYTLQVVYTEE